MTDRLDGAGAPVRPVSYSRGALGTGHLSTPFRFAAHFRGGPA
jgi:hypothetical protein